MEDNKLALLIDSDNVSPKYLNGIFDELAQYGTVTYRRIYGDFTSPSKARWSDRLLERSIIPIQQFSNTTGKNATDSALIIDAMDLLYNSNVDGFCIVSSDSDFTRLASRLRESGKIVIGMGEKKTPSSFRAACTIFTELENLIDGQRSGKVTKDAIEEDIVNIITQNDNKGKPTSPGEIGSKLQNKYPDFDIRTFGYTQLSKFLEDLDAITMRKDSSSLWVALRDDNVNKDKLVDEIVAYVKSRGQSIAMASLGNELHRRYKNFSVQRYGYSQLYAFIESIPELKVVGDRNERRVMYAGNGKDAAADAGKERRDGAPRQGGRRGGRAAEAAAEQAPKEAGPAAADAGRAFAGENGGQAGLEESGGLGGSLDYSASGGALGYAAGAEDAGSEASGEAEGGNAAAEGFADAPFETGDGYAAEASAVDVSDADALSRANEAAFEAAMRDAAGKGRAGRKKAALKKDDELDGAASGGEDESAAKEAQEASSDIAEGASEAAAEEKQKRRRGRRKKKNAAAAEEDRAGGESSPEDMKPAEEKAVEAGAEADKADGAGAKDGGEEPAAAEENAAEAAKTEDKAAKEGRRGRRRKAKADSGEGAEKREGRRRGRP